MTSAELLSVVVPYYQRTAGILRPVIEAALDQRDAPDFEIIVVDDASPVPAEQEIGDIAARSGGRVRIIRQRNAGPGAARNNGLNSLRPGTTYVAFLDSDDLWAPQHLANAMVAMRRGFDFYFSDLLFSDYKTESAFNRAGKLALELHPIIEPAVGT